MENKPSAKGPNYSQCWDQWERNGKSYTGLDMEALAQELGQEYNEAFQNAIYSVLNSRSLNGTPTQDTLDNLRSVAPGLDWDALQSTRPEDQ